MDSIFTVVQTCFRIKGMSNGSGKHNTDVQEQVPQSNDVFNLKFLQPDHEALKVLLDAL